MNYKSINRFFVFTLALVTALAFFGVKPSDFAHKKNFTSIEVSNQLTLNSIHTPGLPHPVGIESKEEQQPSEEDDENLDSDDSTDDSQKSFVQKDLNSLIHTNEVRSTSRGNFHCPLYIRIHSIII